jgi:hypothetical protein
VAAIEASFASFKDEFAFATDKRLTANTAGHERPVASKSGGARALLRTNEKPQPEATGAKSVSFADARLFRPERPARVNERNTPF